MTTPKSKFIIFNEPQTSRTLMTQTSRKQFQSGFTLIELIIVIVILGILAAIAAQKFVDLGKDARISVLNGARGALASTAALAHGKYLTTTPLPTTVTVEGAVVTFATAAASGYPKADTGFASAAGLGAADFTQVTAGSAATANSPATTATETAFIPSGVAGTPAGLACFVKYTEPVAAATAPTITVTTTSC